MRTIRTAAVTAAVCLLAGAWLGLSAGCSSSDDNNPTPDAGADGPAIDSAPDPDTGPDPDGEPPPDAEQLVAECPGSEGCESNEGELLAGAAAVDISPRNYEVGRVSYLAEESFCPEPTPAAPFGLKRCGSLVDDAMTDRADCGLDGLCPEDNLRTRIACDDDNPCSAPLTCNATDGRCYLAYSAPDADGSEGDGVADYFLDCGRDGVCPCLDPDGQPAYYGAGGACLTGHSENPAYSAPDADGSEGNGEFEAIWMAGFSANQPLLGHHDNLWARALVLRTGDTTVAIVSVDLIGFFYPDVQLVRQKVTELVGDAHAVDYVLVSATHTHEGPDTMGQWGPELARGVNQDHLDQVIANAAKAVADAVGTLSKAEVVIGEARTGGEGYFRDSRDPKIIMDEVVALQVNDVASGDTIATVVNWGNHPEALSDTNNYLSSDFPHYVREGMEQAIPGVGDGPELPALGGVSIYLQGPVGCLMTPLGVTVPARDGTLHDKADWGKAEALGTNVAVKAREALQQGETLADPRLSVWAKKILTPVDNSFFVLAFMAKIIDRPVVQDGVMKVETEVGVIRFGDVTFFSMPGEIAPETLVGGFDGSRSFGKPIISDDAVNPPDLQQAPEGPYLIERLPGKYKVPVGLGNDELGYIVPAWNFVLGDTPYIEEAEGDHYEETNSIGPDFETQLLGVYDELIPLLGD